MKDCSWAEPWTLRAVHKASKGTSSIAGVPVENEKEDEAENEECNEEEEEKDEMPTKKKAKAEP